MKNIRIISFNEAREIVNYTHNHKVGAQELIKAFPNYVLDRNLTLSDAALLFKPFTTDYEMFAKMFRNRMFVNGELTFKFQGKDNLIKIEEGIYRVKFNPSENFYRVFRGEEHRDVITNVMRSYMDLYGNCLGNVREYIGYKIFKGDIDTKSLYQETAIIYEYNKGILKSQAVVRFENGIKIGNIVEVETNGFTAVGVLEEGHTYLRISKNYTYKKSKMYDLGTSCPDPMEVIEDKLRLEQYKQIDNVLTADIILERNLFNPQTLGAVSGLSLQEIHNFLNGKAPELHDKIYEAVKKKCDDGTAVKDIDNISPRVEQVKEVARILGYSFEKPTEELVVGCVLSELGIPDNEITNVAEHFKLDNDRTQVAVYLATRINSMVRDGDFKESLGEFKAHIKTVIKHSPGVNEDVKYCMPGSEETSNRVGEMLDSCSPDASKKSSLKEGYDKYKEGKYNGPVSNSSEVVATDSEIEYLSDIAICSSNSPLEDICDAVMVALPPTLVSKLPGNDNIAKAINFARKNY